MPRPEVIHSESCDPGTTYCGLWILGLRTATRKSEVTCKRCLKAIAKREKEKK